jgi:hypothetical protein
MSISIRDYATSSIADTPSINAATLLQTVRSFRTETTQAWQDCFVLLTKEERASLHQEIKLSCDFLTDLTRGA